MNVIFLNNTTRLMAKVMSAADQQLKFTAHYYESSQTNIDEGVNVGALNDDTWVEIVAVATVRRGVKEVTFYNPSSSSQGLVLALDVSGTKTEFLGVTIDANSFFTLSSYEVSVAGATGATGASGGYGFTNNKGWIPSFAMLAPDTDGAYYLGGKEASQIFVETTNTSVFLIINADELPAGTTGIKFRVEAGHADTDNPANRDVRWEMSAGWYNGNKEATLGTAVAVVQTLDIDNTKTAISAQSGTVTINNTVGTDDKLFIKFERVVDNVAEDDTLNGAAYAKRVEHEFVTV